MVKAEHGDWATAEHGGWVKAEHGGWVEELGNNMVMRDLRPLANQVSQPLDQLRVAYHQGGHHHHLLSLMKTIEGWPHIIVKSISHYGMVSVPLHDALTLGLLIFKDDDTILRRFERQAFLSDPDRKGVVFADAGNRRYRRACALLGYQASKLTAHHADCLEALLAIVRARTHKPWWSPATKIIHDMQMELPVEADLLLGAAEEVILGIIKHDSNEAEGRQLWT